MTLLDKNDPTRAVRIGGGTVRLPIALRDPAPRCVPADTYLGLIGLADDPGAIDRLRDWLASGRLPGVAYRGTAYMPRPSFRYPPPDYVPVVRWSAARGHSKQWGHRLIQLGRVRPIWRSRVRSYQHTLVAAWADVEDAA